MLEFFNMGPVSPSTPLKFLSLGTTTDIGLLFSTLFIDNWLKNGYLF